MRDDVQAERGQQLSEKTALNVKCHVTCEVSGVLPALLLHQPLSLLNDVCVDVNPRRQVHFTATTHSDIEPCAAAAAAAAAAAGCGNLGLVVEQHRVTSSKKEN